MGAHRIPTRAIEAAARVRDIHGVVGVDWGLRMRNGRVVGERCLSVSVVRKIKAGVHKKNRLDKLDLGVPVDVLEMPPPPTLAVDRRDRVEAADGKRIAVSPCWASADQDEDKTHILVSGHGVLPYVGGRITRTHTMTSAAVLRDNNKQVGGRVIDGEIRSHSDWAWIVLDKTHPITAGSLPKKPSVARFPKLGSTVSFASHHGSARCRVEGIPIEERPVTLPDGSTLYCTLIRGRMLDRDIKAGDSGALVVDQYKRAVGMVEAGTNRSVYFLKIQSLPTRVLQRFFNY